MRKTPKFLKRLRAEDCGITSVEYALLLAFVAAGVILAAQTLGNAVSNQMNDVTDCISSGTAGSDECEKL